MLHHSKEGILFGRECDRRQIETWHRHLYEPERLSIDPRLEGRVTTRKIDNYIGNL